MKIKFRLYFFVLLFFFQSINAQSPLRHSVADPIPPDSVDIKYYAPKNWIMATSQIFGLNMGIWAFNRYGQKANFAYINLKTIGKNFQHGFVWDNDQLSTNMFAHPYHGNLYFNAARSNGYNYWESGTFALGGSAMWELFMENEYPSINDIIATPVGGAAIGEVLYRTSDLVLDDRSRGSERFGRELAGFLINPTRGLTRIINGDAWRKRRTSGKQFGVPDVSLNISSGVRVLKLKDDILDEGLGIATTIDVEYGDRFDTDNTKPYDYFLFRSNLNFHSSQPVLSQLNIMGRLFVGNIIDSPKDFLSLGFYQHFDYYDSDTISNVSNRIPYKFGVPASFGAGFIYKNKQKRKFNFDMFFHMNAILLGSSLSDHYKVDMRNYNLGSGFSIKTGINVYTGDKFCMYAGLERYAIYTWKGYPQGLDWTNVNPHEFNYQGDKSRAIIHVINLSADLKLRKQLYLRWVITDYIRDTRYKYFEDVLSHTAETKLLLSYRF